MSRPSWPRTCPIPWLLARAFAVQLLDRHPGPGLLDGTDDLLVGVSAFSRIRHFPGSTNFFQLAWCSGVGAGRLGRLRSETPPKEKPRRCGVEVVTCAEERLVLFLLFGLDGNFVSRHSLFLSPEILLVICNLSRVFGLCSHSSRRFVSPHLCLIGFQLNFAVF